MNVFGFVFPDGNLNSYELKPLALVSQSRHRSLRSRSTQQPLSAQAASLRASGFVLVMAGAEKVGGWVGGWVGGGGGGGKGGQKKEDPRKALEAMAKG